MHGAPGTLYVNEIFQLQVDFPEHYPMEAPQVGIIVVFVFDSCIDCEKVAIFIWLC